MTIAHYILTINPQAQYEWDKCILRNPITGERPDFTSIISQAVGNEPGSYLVAVNIEVQVLEKAPICQSQQVESKESESKKVRSVANTKLARTAALKLTS